MRYGFDDLRNAVHDNHRFFLFVIGRGNGCDYTRGCNVNSPRTTLKVPASVKPNQSDYSPRTPSPLRGTTPRSDK